jgi:hypothetical protein
VDNFLGLKCNHRKKLLSPHNIQSILGRHRMVYTCLVNNNTDHPDKDIAPSRNFGRKHPTILANNSTKVTFMLAGGGFCVGGLCIRVPPVQYVAKKLAAFSGLYPRRS